MEKTSNEYYSCYDEMLSMLFSTSFEDINGIAKATTKNNGISLSLISRKPQIVFSGVEKGMFHFFNILDNNNYDNAYDLTGHEIILYSLLLHKCIETQDEEATITYEELQRLRKKRFGKTKLLDDKTYKAYNKVFIGLSNKIIQYDLGDKRENKNITYRKYQHPLLIIYDVTSSPNHNLFIKYSLGPFGKTLIESKRYGKLVPRQYFQINFNEIMSYQIALYICRLIYIERRKHKAHLTVKLTSIMKNIDKYMNSNKHGLVKCCNAFAYSGPNVKRLWDATINKVNVLLEILKSEMTIIDFKSNLDLQYSEYYTISYTYQNVKWILYFK